MKTLSVETHSRDGMIDITEKVCQVVSDSGVQDGICLVYCPHTTAGITINENADPDVVKDLLVIMNRVIPWKMDYQHREGNSAAHAKSSLFGASAKLIIQNGKLVLGTWQSVFFCEFDGPRQRKFMVQTIAA